MPISNIGMTSVDLGFYLSEKRISTSNIDLRVLICGLIRLSTWSFIRDLYSLLLARNHNSAKGSCKQNTKNLSCDSTFSKILDFSVKFYIFQTHFHSPMFTFSYLSIVKCLTLIVKLPLTRGSRKMD